jgi:hypothetical protein
MITIFLLFFLNQLCKALTDGFLWSKQVVDPIKIYINKGNNVWLIEWFYGIRGLLTKKVNQGYPWSCDYWHFWDTTRNITAILMFCFMPLVLMGVKLLDLALFGWFCYWFPTFTFFYKYIQMKEWTFSFWLKDNIVEAVFFTAAFVCLKIWF